MVLPATHVIPYFYKWQDLNLDPSNPANLSYHDPFTPVDSGGSYAGAAPLGQKFSLDAGASAHDLVIRDNGMGITGPLVNWSVTPSAGMAFEVMGVLPAIEDQLGSAETFPGEAEFFVAKQGLAAEIPGVSLPLASRIHYAGGFEITGSDGSTGTVLAVFGSPPEWTQVSINNAPGVPVVTFDYGSLIGYASTIPLNSGVTYTTTGRFTHPSIPYSDLNASLICFTEGTMIETDRGAVPVESLSVGDLLVTRDNGLQPIRWIGSRFVSAGEMAGNEKLLPIRVKSWALGEGRPDEDLLVSQQHRVLVRSRICEKMFGEREVLVAVKQLLQLDGVDISPDCRDLTYFHILCDQHEVIVANGAETETMLPGPQALKSLNAEALEEINTLFPEFFSIDYVPSPARYIPSGRRGRKMVVRHRQNSRPLVEQDQP